MFGQVQSEAASPNLEKRIMTGLEIVLICSLVVAVCGGIKISIGNINIGKNNGDRKD